MGTPVPAFCENCGTVFTTPFTLHPGGSLQITGNPEIGPCPTCGAFGRIPDGLYEWAEEVRDVISSWSAERLQAFAAGMEAARQSAKPRTAVETAIQSDPDLREIAKRLLIPRDAAAFWAFFAVLLSLIVMFGGQQGVNITVNAAPNRPAATAPAPHRAKPPPPRKQKPKGHGKRKK